MPAALRMANRIVAAVAAATTTTTTANCPKASIQSRGCEILSRSPVQNEFHRLVLEVWLLGLKNWIKLHAIIQI